jgi:hypothetical protein
VPGIFGAGGIGVNVNTGALIETIDADLAAALRASSATRGTYLLNGSPTGVQRANLDRRYLASNLSALTTQVLLSAALELEAGDIVTNLTFVSGATAANTPTNWWFALYSSAATPALLSQTADQTSTAWAANTAKTVALAAPQTITTSGVYYAAIMVKATTPPTLAGVAVENAAVAGAVVTGQAILAQTSGSSLTTTAPATVASPTTVANVPYVIAT